MMGRNFYFLLTYFEISTIRPKDAIRTQMLGVVKDQYVSMLVGQLNDDSVLKMLNSIYMICSCNDCTGMNIHLKTGGKRSVPS